MDLIMFFSLSGIFCIFGGTFILSRNLLLKGLKGEVVEKLIKDDKPIDKLYRIIAEKMFGLKGNSALLVLFDPTNTDTVRLEKLSIYEPIRGMLWIIFGTLLQVIGIVGFNKNLAILFGIIIVSASGTYFFLILRGKTRDALKRGTQFCRVSPKGASLVTSEIKENKLMSNEQPLYDREKEYCFARDMANQVNAQISTLLITLSAGAIVLGQSMNAIVPFANASLWSKMFLIGGWSFFVFSIISGINVIKKIIY